MDSLQLLNVLDVIKNEEIYTKRLNQLQAVQAKLDQSSYIVATVEIAEKRLKDAEIDKEKAAQLVIKLEKDLKSIRQEIEKEYVDKLAQIAQREKSVLLYQSDAKKFLEEGIKVREDNEKERKVLTEWDKVLIAQKAELKALEATLIPKFMKIKQIIEE